MQEYNRRFTPEFAHYQKKTLQYLLTHVDRYHIIFDEDINKFVHVIRY